VKIQEDLLAKSRAKQSAARNERELSAAVREIDSIRKSMSEKEEERLQVMEAIDPLKDVDGFHPDNVGRLMLGRPRFVACTPLGILELLDRLGVPLEGQRAVVVGRSATVGKPVAALLTSRPPRARRLLFSDQAVVRGAQLLKDRIVLFENGRPSGRFDLEKFGLIGSHNRENLAAACLAARDQGATDEGIQQTIYTFKPSPHRPETVATVRGVMSSRAATHCGSAVATKPASGAGADHDHVK